MAVAGITGCGGDRTPREVASERWYGLGKKRRRKHPRGGMAGAKATEMWASPGTREWGCPAGRRGRAGGEVRKGVKTSIHTSSRPRRPARAASRAPGVQAWRAHQPLQVEKFRARRLDISSFHKNDKKRKNCSADSAVPAARWKSKGRCGRAAGARGLGRLEWEGLVGGSLPASEMQRLGSGAEPSASPRRSRKAQPEAATPPASLIPILEGG